VAGAEPAVTARERQYVVNSKLSRIIGNPSFADPARTSNPTGHDRAFFGFPPNPLMCRRIVEFYIFSMTVDLSDSIRFSEKRSFQLKGTKIEITRIRYKTVARQDYTALQQ
jgi:hypothetical protein